VRTPIDLPLIGVIPSGGIPSAVFRAGAEYEAPAIVERTPIDLPLIGAAPSGVTCAVFRPETISAGR
jgi:hypothetical protein